MPAQSKAQQRFMGMVHAAQKGELENPSKEVEKAADSMSDADAKDYASTKHKGLPDHVKKENMEKQLKEIIRQTYRESLRESVNETQYPTDLKVGSVILGQGFTMLKGIEGGKYYKVVAMDDYSATLVPSDKSGNVKGSTKVRHKLDSIEGGIKTAKRGDENGIVVIKESINEGKFKEDDLVYNKRTKTVGIVRIGDDKYGEVKTDADGNVDVDELEKFNPIKNKHHQNAKVAPSTEKEINNRGLFNPFKNESINEGVSHEAMGIAKWTNTRQEAVQKFIDDNNLDAQAILKDVTKGKLPERVRFIQALVGTPGNSSFKWYVKNYANESVVTEGKKAFKVNPPIGKAKYSISSHDGSSTHKDGSDFWDIKIFKNKVDLEKGIKDYKSKGFIEESVIKEGVYKSILSNNKGKLFFSLVDDETDKVTDVDAKAWLKSSIVDKSSDNSKELVLSALVRQINQFNKKVDFNMWVNANKPTWEEKVKYLFDKGLANNVNKTGIKVH